jgi:ABC-type transport system involved in Fe-S cluster assembly fused permease/ATPase subunit
MTANLLLGTYGVINGALSTGDLVMMQSVMVQMLAPLFFLGVTYRAWFDSLIDIKELYNITDIKPSIVERADCLALPQCQGKLSFK